MKNTTIYTIISTKHTQSELDIYDTLSIIYLYLNRKLDLNFQFFELIIKQTTNKKPSTLPCLIHMGVLHRYYYYTKVLVTNHKDKIRVTGFFYRNESRKMTGTSTGGTAGVNSVSGFGRTERG